MRWIALAGSALAAGCVNYVDTVHVRVRDPAAVAVSIDTPTGRQSLLAANDIAMSPLIPPTRPPYLEAEQPGAFVERVDHDGIKALCVWCLEDRERQLVTADGHVALAGAPDHVLSRTGDVMHMRFDYETALKCHRSHGNCDRPAFALSLDTPRANLLDLHFERRVETSHGELFGAKVSLGAGVLATAFGIFLVGVAVDHGGSTSGRFLIGAGGVGGLAIGALFLGTGIATLRARDSDTAILPP